MVVFCAFVYIGCTHIIGRDLFQWILESRCSGAVWGGGGGDICAFI